MKIGTDYTKQDVLVEQMGNKTVGYKNIKGQVTDSITISKEGFKALNDKQSGEVKESYDAKKVMELHEKYKNGTITEEENEYYKNARKNNPALDVSLYEADKAEALDFVAKVQAIILKSMTGQKLTSEEQQMVDSDPALSQEIEKRKSEMNIVK